MSNNRKSLIRGFTLIEILVVIAIIAILAGLGLGSYMSAQMKSRDARRKADLDVVAKALEVYLNDKGQYPEDGAGAIKGCQTTVDGPIVTCEWGVGWHDGHNTFYLNRLPTDPSNSTYYYESDGTKYVLYAHLENTKDSAVPKDGVLQWLIIDLMVGELLVVEELPVTTLILVVILILAI